MAAENPISMEINIEPLVQNAVEEENVRFEQGGDDSEGLGVTSRPPSPLTEIESEGDGDGDGDGETGAMAQLHPSSKGQSIRVFQRCLT